MRYKADTGNTLYEFEADCDEDAAAIFPHAMIWRADGDEISTLVFSGIEECIT